MHLIQIPLIFVDNDIEIVTDLFANQYGLGSCRSILEYAEYVGEMHIDDIDIYTQCIKRRLMAMNGVDPDTGSMSTYDNSVSQNFVSTPKSNVSAQNGMVMFLKDSGISKDEIQKALEEIKDKDLGFVDVSDITTANLMRSDFDIKSAIQRMKQNQGKGKSFIVNASTISKGNWAAKVITEAKSKSQKKQVG